MKKLSKILALFLAVTLFTLAVSACLANSVSATEIPYSYALIEGNSGTLLYTENAYIPFPTHHSSKLMTLLLLSEAIERNELSEDTVIKVSPHANAQQGAQIWLSAGEEISISELITSITVGNANDACVAIAEAVCQTEEKFTERMNLRASELGMTQTIYSNSTGMGEGNLTTVADLAILASALSKHEYLVKYMTTWQATVRGGKVELASTNRFIRSYEGATGMKAYYSKDCGNCLIASAKKGDLTLICVILGEPDEYNHFKTAKEKLNIGFSAYTLYTPNKKAVFCESVRVKNGVQSFVETELEAPKAIVVRKSQKENIEFRVEYFENIQAPLKKGDAVGRVVYFIDDTDIFELKIVAKDDVLRQNFGSAMLKCLKYLFGC